MSEDGIEALAFADSDNNRMIKNLNINNINKEFLYQFVY